MKKQIDKVGRRFAVSMYYIGLLIRGAVHRWRSLDYKYTWRWRVANGFVALLLLVTIAMPVMQSIWERNRYELSAEASQLVGTTDQSLAKQLTYDAPNGRYQFNKDAVTTGGDAGLPAEIQKASVGAANKSNTKTYSLDVPEDFSKGVTYHDTNSQLSFSLVPQFDALRGKVVNGHIVFPVGGDAQAVYTLKNNGLKEDIVVQKAAQDTMRFSYDLQLPKTLVAKALPDGSGGIGIYSADPSLFGGISYGSDKDRAAIEKARETADKTYLVFGLPAPVITASEQGGVGKATSRFELNNGVLTVVAENLDTTKGTISIDPSVVVTATSDFQTGGNNEGMIDFGTSGQITRGGLTGGTIGGWTATTSLTNALEQGSSAVYNGYIYQFGGYNRNTTVRYATSNYAQINSDGTLGSWSTTTALPYTYNYMQTVAYNGYMYLLGGIKVTTNNATAEVFVAPINSNGTLGAWSTTTNLPAAISGGAATAYNGYMYYFGGATTVTPPACNGSSTCLDTAYYAPLNADGSLGAWLSLATLSVQRSYGSAIAYNGYMYLLAGLQNSGLIPTTSAVQYALIKSDGTLGSWMSTNSFSSARYATAAYVYNGYLYIATGYNGKSDVQYAPVYANGSVGTWQAATSMGTGLTYATGVAYNGYLYLMNGYDGTNDHNDVWYTKIDRAGKPVAFGTLTNNFTTARANICSVAYNGYLYALGGSTADSPSFNVTTVQYSALNSSTGNNGSWSSTTALPISLGSTACIAHNGYLYVTSGWTGTGSVGSGSSQMYYVAINSNGTLGASWTTSANSPPFGERPGLFVYGSYMYQVTDGTGSNVSSASLNASTGAPGTWGSAGASNMVNSYGHRAYAQVGKYLYAFGGLSTGTVYATVEYAPITGSGTIGTWTATTSMNTAIGFTNGTTVNGCIYSVGGENGATVSMNNVQYACPNADGTISAWYNAPNLTVATTDMGVTSYNGYIYGVGGYTTSVQTTTQYAYVNNGGSGSNGTWVAGSNNLAGNTIFGKAVSYNGYVYVVGGTDGSTEYNTVQYSQLAASGDLGSFTNDSHTFTNSRGNAGATVYNGYLYMLGGAKNGGAARYGDVQYAPIGNSGALSGNFASTTSFVTGTGSDTAREGACVTAYNGYMYAIGGYDGTSYHADTRYAAINSNGTLGSWADSGNNLGSGETPNGCFVANGYLYMVGSDSVQSALVNANGTLGAWKYTSRFHTSRSAAVAAYSNGFVYIYGGCDTTSCSTNYGDTQFAPVYAGGTLGKWQHTTTSFTSYSISVGTGVAANGNLYLFGGNGVGASRSATYYAPLNTISRTARYSKLIDLGNPVSVSSITYNGTLPTSGSTPGVTPIYYRAAGSDKMFGSQAVASNITPNVSDSCLTSNVNYTRYLEVTVVLDDSNTGVFADANSTLSNVTDFTVSYITPHPNPNIRLRLGQTMQSGNLSPLDTCYDALIASYGFNEGTGSTAAPYKGSQTLTVGPSTSWISGHSGGSALTSSGGGSLGTYGQWNNVDMTNATIMAWCKPTDLTAGSIRPLFGVSQGNDASVYNSEFNIWAQRSDFGTPNILQGDVRVNGSLQSVNGPALTTNQWVHVALTYDGTNLRLYVNGSLYATQAASGTADIGNFSFNVLSGSGNAYGAVDDVRVYSRALSAADISAVMNTTVP